MLCTVRHISFGSHALTDEVEMKREFLLYSLVCTMSWKTITGLHYVIINRHTIDETLCMRRACNNLLI